MDLNKENVIPSAGLNPSLASPYDHILSATPVASTSKLALPKKTRQDVQYRRYQGEDDIADIMGLVDTELSEPYNIYTYRYFLSDWPNLCFMAYDGKIPVGTILCKQEIHRDKLDRGYIAMLSTKEEYRGLGVATHLARLAISEMVLNACEEIVLETEVDNVAALGFYSKLGFIREKRLYRFYLNAKDAFRLSLPITKEVRAGLDLTEVGNLVRELDELEVGKVA